MPRRLVVPPTRYQPSRSGARPSPITRQPKIATVTSRVRDRKLFPWRPIFRIIFASLAVALVVWALNSPIFLVRSTTVQGLRNVPEEVIRSQVPLHSNLWLFPVGSVSKKIKKASPLIADVGIYRGIPNAIRIVVAERILALDWESGGKHYLIGLDGKVIEQSDPPTPLIKVVDTSGLAPENGQAVATPGFVQFVQALQQSFKTVLGVDLDHLEIGDTTFDVTVIPKSGPKLLLESTRNPSVQLKAAKEVLDQFKDGVKEYLDMRVPGKAYYK